MFFRWLWLILFIFFTQINFINGEIFILNMCLNILNDTLREVIVDQHNSLRSQLAHGHSIIKGGIKASPAKNMFKLYYDCELERSAQAWANECIWNHSEYDVGENLFMIGAYNYDKLDTIIKATDDWWKELYHVGGITSTNTIYSRSLNNLRIGHWTQMAWAKTTFIGCGYKSCLKPSNRTILVCHYLPHGNVINRPIYEIGTPCQTDNNCTTYPFSTCENSTGLCDRFSITEIPETLLKPDISSESSETNDIHFEIVKKEILEKFNKSLEVATFEKSKFVETFEDFSNYGKKKILPHLIVLILIFVYIIF